MEQLIEFVSYRQSSTDSYLLVWIDYGSLSFIMEQLALRLLSLCYLALLECPDNGTAQKAEFCSIHPLSIQR